MAKDAATIDIMQDDPLSGQALKFAALVKQWQEETAPLSSMTEIVLNPAYQRIIGMGPDALPLILREFAARPAHWFWALSAISGENPVPPDDAGKLGKMTEAWLQWGRERGLC